MRAGGVGRVVALGGTGGKFAVGDWVYSTLGAVTFLPGAPTTITDLSLSLFLVLQDGKSTPRLLRRRAPNWSESPPPFVLHLPAKAYHANSFSRLSSLQCRTRNRTFALSRSPRNARTGAVFAFPFLPDRMRISPPSSFSSRPRTGACSTSPTSKPEKP